MTNNAKDYAAAVAAGIWERNATGAPFGYVCEWDDSTVETLEEIDGYDPDEHDDDNLPDGWSVAGGYDCLRDVLDIEYRITAERQYRSAYIFLTVGGPNAYVDTAARELVVNWGFETARESLPGDYVRALDEAAEELWEMGA